jgi:hypothetical protein
MAYLSEVQVFLITNISTLEKISSTFFQMFAP